MSDHRCATAAVLADEFESNLGKFEQTSDISEILDGDDDSVFEEGYEEVEPSEPVLAAKCLEESATSPATGKGLDFVASNEEDGEPETSLKIMLSEESSLPLMSALKGGREKMGASPRKLSVTWDPDVYDPIPNSLSHSVKSKQKKSRKDRDRDNSNYNRKNGKKGQKGNSSKGSAGKDKKQSRKQGVKPDRAYKTHDGCDHSNDFDIGSPNYCGSSFLKKSVTEFHYSVAEAL